MPHTLLVAATEGETELLRKRLNMDAQREHYWETSDQAVGLLHTGIGMVNTAWALGQYFASEQPQLAVNIGIAGAFDRSLEIGEVVEVVEDIFSEMGAQSPEGFLDLQSLGFPFWKDQDKPLYNTWENPAPQARSLKQVRGITVNTVHGLAEPIKLTVARWQPQVESMEGAAFIMAARRAGIPAFAFRSISNYVEVRNRNAWDIPLALRKLTDFLVEDLLRGG